ncbi:hypothetical protein CDD83_5230 [Cordyceps sp. RAO-2017]|nr:hypothetical protein CDD83_5230 [Cordyceps sp. RAO-2017]
MSPPSVPKQAAEAQILPTPSTTEAVSPPGSRSRPADGEALPLSGAGEGFGGRRRRPAPYPIEEPGPAWTGPLGFRLDDIQPRPPPSVRLGCDPRAGSLRKGAPRAAEARACVRVSVGGASLARPRRREPDSRPGWSGRRARFGFVMELGGRR